MADSDDRKAGKGLRAWMGQRGWPSGLKDAANSPPRWLLLAVALLIGTIFVWQVVLLFKALGAGLKYVDSINKLMLGIGALLGAPFVVWQVLISRKNSQTQLETMYTTLFTKAVEQLGAMREHKLKVVTTDAEGKKQEREEVRMVPNLEVRLGAIYALERIAQDSERDHWPIMETLCAYVRENSWIDREGRPISKEPIPEEVLLDLQLHKFYGDALPNDHWLSQLPKPRPDIQAVMTVIGRRSAERRGKELKDSRYLDFQEAYLAFVNLYGAQLDGANFSRARLECADFEEAHLGRADLSTAHLMGAVAIGVHLARADLSEAHLEGACLFGAHLEAAYLWGAHLEFTNLLGAQFEAAELNEAHFVGAWFRWAQFEGALVREANFESAVELTQAQINSAIGDWRTTLPPDLVRPDHWLRDPTERGSTLGDAPPTPPQADAPLP